MVFRSPSISFSQPSTWFQLRTLRDARLAREAAHATRTGEAVRSRRLPRPGWRFNGDGGESRGCALGIRNAIGLFVHPNTGEIWETENGPMGGDEINIIEAGRNYGWPVVSYGRDYTGNTLGGLSGTSSEHPWWPGMEEPLMLWMPSPALSGITFCTGDKVPAWKSNAFVGALGRGDLGSRQLHRLVLNENGTLARNGNRTLLAELRQRIRDVRQGPDGLLYLTIDEAQGTVVRVEPVEMLP